MTQLSLLIGARIFGLFALAVWLAIVLIGMGVIHR